MRRKSKNPKRYQPLFPELIRSSSPSTKDAARTTDEGEDDERERKRKISKIGAQLLLLSSSMLGDDAGDAERRKSDEVKKARIQSKSIQEEEEEERERENIGSIDISNAAMMSSLQQTIMLACGGTPNEEVALAEARKALQGTPLMNLLVQGALGTTSSDWSTLSSTSLSSSYLISNGFMNFSASLNGNDHKVNHMQCAFIEDDECKSEHKRRANGTKKMPSTDLVNVPLKYIGPHAGKKCCRSCWNRIYRNTAQRPLPFACDKCELTFKKEHLLLAHVRVDHEGKQPYLCSFPNCEKGFTRPSDLRKHRLVHTGEKPHKCEYCDCSFISSSNLNKHRRQHTGEKPYSCRVCLRKFTRSIGLRNHVNSQHLKQTNWSSVGGEEGEEIGDEASAFNIPIHILRVPGETTNASQKRSDAERIPISKSEQRLELYLNLLAERNGLRVSSMQEVEDVVVTE